MALAEWIKQKGRELGFDRVGFAPAADLPELARFPEWLERGYAGKMDYMQNPRRADVRRLLPDARTVICCALNYDTRQPRSTEVPPDPERGWLSRYAWGEDYHRILTEKLQALREAIADELRKSENRKEKIEKSEQSPAAGALRLRSLRLRSGQAGQAAGLSRGETGEKHIPRGGSLGAQDERKIGSTEPPGSCLGEGQPGYQPAGSASESFEAKLYVDTGPVLERVYGKHAGLGWQGKNTCLLDEELGSFFFLGVLVTNLELAPDLPPPDGCGACTLCLEACPTGALVEPYVMDARRCISYLTIELRGSIPEEFRPALGRHVFGCDICQDVCPYNQRARVADLAAFQPRRLETPRLRSGQARKSKLENRPVGTEHRAPSIVHRAQEPGPQAPSTEHESLFHPRLEWLASLSEEEFRQVFRESAVRRAKRRGLLRNTLVAMGNSGHPHFRPLLEKFAASDDPLLAEHAQRALQQLIVKSR